LHPEAGLFGAGSSMEGAQAIKLLLVGDGAVGKSQLLLRYMEARFDPNFITTIGVDFRQKKVVHRGSRLCIQVWDAAGQERFRTISPAYYAKAHGVMIVYDITNHASFRSVEHWKHQVKEYGGREGLPVLVVGNKTDLVDEHMVSLRVSSDEEEHLSEKLGVSFRTTSAKLGQGVEEAFTALIDLTQGLWCASDKGRLAESLVDEGSCEVGQTQPTALARACGCLAPRNRRVAFVAPQLSQEEGPHISPVADLSLNMRSGHVGTASPDGPDAADSAAAVAVAAAAAVAVREE